MHQFLDPLRALYTNQTNFTFSFATDLGVDKVVLIVHGRFGLFLSFVAPQKQMYEHSVHTVISYTVKHDCLEQTVTTKKLITT